MPYWASCKGSHKSARSGVRCWMAFVGACAQPVAESAQHPCAYVADKYDPIRKRYFPPPLDLLLPWTTLFRSGQTLRNYLGYVQTACIMFEKPTQVRQCSGSLRSNAASLMQCRFSLTQRSKEPRWRWIKRSILQGGSACLSRSRKLKN